MGLRRLERQSMVDETGDIVCIIEGYQHSDCNQRRRCVGGTAYDTRV